VPPTPEDIVALYESRRKHYQPIHAAMIEVQSIYDGRMAINLPDVPDDIATSVPNLLAQGVDQMAARIASTSPQPWFSPDLPGNRPAERRADTARRVISGWWQEDRHGLKNKVRARRLVAYGMSPVSIRFDAKCYRPTWAVREPLETYPNPDETFGYRRPVDIIFAYRRTIGWLRGHGWGSQVDAISSNYGAVDDRDSLMLLLEYVDEEGTRLVLTGWRNDTSPEPGSWLAAPMWASSRRGTVLLADYPSGGVMTAFAPTRLTLNRPGGQFDTMTGMYYQQAKLMALEVMAVEKGVYPDTYLVSRPGEQARFIDGPHDGRSGLVNIVQGGDIKQVVDQPGYMTPQVIDRLERAQRVTSGLPSEFGGESGSNIRTGRRGDSVLSAVIDFPIAENQEVLAQSLVDEDKAAIALAKRYDGRAKRTIYVGTGNASRAVTYIADDVFVNDEHVVSYPVSGTDLNALTIGLGQRVGLGTLSKETAATIDPFISDPEGEHDRIVAEGLEQALMSGIQQQAAGGQIPPLVVAKIINLVRSDKMELPEALAKVAEDAAKEQAAQQAQQAQAGGPPPGPPTADQMAAPAAAQAMAGPQGAIPGANGDQQSLATLLSTLRTPGRTIIPGRNIPNGGM
jgi:hypothetical protein